MGYWGPPRIITRRHLLLGRRELLDLIVSWAALTIAFGAGYLFRGSVVGLGVSGLAVATAFLFHELAHREVARRYGLVARYRAWYTGLLLAVVIALVTAKATGSPFVLAAPGAVVIFSYYGPPPPYVELRVASAGPLSNIIVGLAFSIASRLAAYSWSYYLGLIGSINLWIAFFNLLPIPPLDGSKIMRYSFTTWIILFASALILYFVF